jgi:hypothetical protein
MIVGGFLILIATCIYFCYYPKQLPPPTKGSLAYYKQKWLMISSLT